MELLGTDAEPDWHLFDGGWEGVTVDTRTNEDATAVVASADELKRYEESKTTILIRNIITDTRPPHSRGKPPN